MNPLHISHDTLPETLRDKHTWTGLRGSSLALAIGQTARYHTSSLVIITPDLLTTHRLEQELQFFAPDIPLFVLPDWETLPYDNFSPHQDILSQRLLTLYRLPALQQGIILVPIATAMQRLAPRQYIESNTFILKTHDTLDINKTRLRLESAGYRYVSQVIEHGEFTIRGAILDLFPMGSTLPYRIDLLDEEVDSIRHFDPDTQRSTTVVEEIHLLPAREFPMSDAAISHFRQQWRDVFSGNPTNCPVYQDITQGITPAGIEYFLPLFFEHTETLFDYLPADSLLIRIGDLAASAENFWKEVKERHEQRRHDITRPILTPNTLFLSVDEVFGQMKPYSQITIQNESGKINFEIEALPDLSIEHKQHQPLSKLENYLRENKGRILFCAETPGRREALLDLLKTIHIQPHTYASWQEFLDNNDPISITIAPLDTGFSLTDPNITLIAESQLFGQQVLQYRRRKSQTTQTDAVVRNLAELHLHSPIVHIDHGIGRYLGLQTLQLGDMPAEYLTLEYAGGDKLYVPVSSLHLISRYSGGNPDLAPLHRLGTEQWQKAKRKAAEQVRDTAAELLDIYARRAARPGHSFDYPEAEYQTFASAFPFEETPDQQQAIMRVIEDMKSSKSMDRLICGDVGFGKTEVAMRAAFIAVQAGKQVAILVPTTLLAQQHYQNFSDRFADWPVHVDVISRFRSHEEQQTILKKLEAGKVDILIGTHKLLQKDIKFTRLGLLIIDEEHRFGVQQKERLKALRSEVDILTMTATPIPRTLNMAMSGMRDLSIIATPPARRLSIKTFVCEKNNAQIREAILREVLRGGQVYFLHNAVETIEKVAHDLSELVPEARIAIAHGQMRERELERVMVDFYHQRFNILLCTTIIETGIDVPSANTIIIDKADRFGLAQLHQLRGRVGRSHHQAYAYLLTAPEKTLTADAKKRLDAIISLEDLGAGFTLATHDLEIRGAGELLGEEQSGNMQAIGFSLYMELLERAVKALQSGKQPDTDLSLHNGAEIDLQIPALIPESYVHDVHSRLILYKRIANAPDQEALKEIQIEMIDRFGLLPQPTQQLFQITELKLKVQPIGIRKIDASNKGGRIEFEPHPNIDPLRLIQLIQKESHQYKLDPSQRLLFSWNCNTPPEKLAGIEQILNKLIKI